MVRLMRLFCFLFWAAALQAEVRLPAVISDHMVVQAGKPASLWGWAEKGGTIKVGFAGQTRTTKADGDGRWRLTLDALPASSEPRELRINEKIIKDVLVGEVWLASGQSNMAMQIDGPLHGKVDQADAVIAAAKHPEIRVFVHDEPFAIYELPVPADGAAADRAGRWRVCSPETVADFSAMGFFFARDLLAELGQPTGIITAAVGGTPIEAWTSLAVQEKTAELKPLLADWTKRLDGFVPEQKQREFLEAKASWLKRRAAAVKAGQAAPKAPAPFKNLQVMKPGGLFSGMIAPLVPYTMRGVIWYQGERNAAGPFTGLYGLQMRLLIADWRAHWRDDLHFAWVQLPAFLGPQKLPAEPAGWGVAVRDGQRQALEVPGTSMAITLDLGGEKSGHPTNKEDYAKRLSRVVLHDVYERKNGLPTGPILKTCVRKNGRLVVSFKHATGLHAKSGKLDGFAIAGTDGRFVWSNAKIEGDTVVLWHGRIAEPKAACYAWAGHPRGNLVNADGLPASPFMAETDD